METTSQTRDIVAELLGALRSSDAPLMATEIAGRLREAGHENADRKVVNHLLYGPLKGQVRQDASYRWTLAERSVGVKHASPSAGQPQAASRTPTWSRFGHYVDYYKKCVAEDEHPESSYPLFKLNRDFLCHPLREEWCTSGQSHVSIELDAGMRDFAIQLRKRGNSGALFYGYPLHIQWVRAQSGWEGGFAVPVFLQTIEYTLNGNTLELYHKKWDGARCKADIIRDIRLTALGWKVKRFWVYRVRDEMDQCVQEVIDALAAARCPMTVPEGSTAAPAGHRPSHWSTGRPVHRHASSDQHLEVHYEDGYAVPKKPGDPGIS